MNQLWFLLPYSFGAEESEVEKYHHKVAAVFTNEADALKARGEMFAAGYTAAQISIVSPAGTNADSQIEPEGDEVAKSVVRDAAIGTVVGGAAGAVGTAMLAAASVPLMVSPVIATTFMVGWGASVGAFTGAGVGVGMDEDQFAGLIKDAAQQKRWVLVIQTRDEAESQTALKQIEDLARGPQQTASI